MILIAPALPENSGFRRIYGYIYQAIGVRMNELPMSPGRVIAKLLAKK